MYNFKKIFGLVGVVTVFTGLAYGQATCTTATAPAGALFIRAEGTTELVAPLVLTCNGNGTAGVLNLSVYLSPAVTVTSKVLSTSGATSGQTEAQVVISGGGTSQGVVNSNQVTFPGVATPAGAFTATVNNVRVNASTLSLGSGIPPAITEAAFISGTNISANAFTPGATVAFVGSGLGTVKFTATPNNYVVCNALVAQSGGAPTAAFSVTVTEGFTAAFKSYGSPGAGSLTEGSQTAAVIGTTTNNANSGTRVKLTFTNVPTGVSIYTQSVVTSSTDAAQITSVTSETGSSSGGVTPTTPVGITGGFSTFGAGNVPSQVAVSGGTGSAIYEVTLSDPGTDTFSIPVYFTAGANTVPASSTGIGVSVSLAPVGSTVIPNFVVGSSTVALTGSTFSTCTTSLLFPFVTNQLGFDTGIAIANTSADPFGTTKGATPQSGTCALNFYGDGAPSPANVVTPSVASGKVFTQVLSGVAAGFQGYMIAQCNFQYAHGFAFITDGVGTNGGLSQGYLAGVIPDTNQTNRRANPLSVAVAGTGESLGN